MKKIFAALSLAIMATACTPLDLVSSAGTPPAPLQKTVIDEKALLATWDAFDVALSAIDALVATGYIVKDTPFALKIKGYVETTQTALNAATAAQKAGSATDYITALTEAQKAMKLAGAALKAGK